VENKIYLIKFVLIALQKWCQKWDVTTKIYQLHIINSIIYNNQNRIFTMFIVYSQLCDAVIRYANRFSPSYRVNVVFVFFKLKYKYFYISYIFDFIGCNSN